MCSFLFASPWYIKLTTQLVDEDFVKTGCREERLISVDSNHRNLCNVSGDAAQLEFIKEVLEDARLQIASTSPSCMGIQLYATIVIILILSSPLRHRRYR
jgi:hypothetical protein